MLHRRLMPGQPGTKKWVKKYGDRLVCVRYRYDAENKIKTKTIEIIVEQSPWVANTKRIPKNKIVNIRVAYGEIHIGRLIKAAGGHWDRQKKLWALPYQDVLSLGLEKRMVSE